MVLNIFNTTIREFNGNEICNLILEAHNLLNDKGYRVKETEYSSNRLITAEPRLEFVMEELYDTDPETLPDDWEFHMIPIQDFDFEFRYAFSCPVEFSDHEVLSGWQVDADREDGVRASSKLIMNLYEFIQWVEKLPPAKVVNLDEE